MFKAIQFVVLYGSLKKESFVDALYQAEKGFFVILIYRVFKIMSKCWGVSTVLNFSRTSFTFIDILFLFLILFISFLYFLPLSLFCFFFLIYWNLYYWFENSYFVTFTSVNFLLCSALAAYHPFCCVVVLFHSVLWSLNFPLRLLYSLMGCIEMCCLTLKIFLLVFCY